MTRIIDVEGKTGDSFSEKNPSDSLQDYFDDLLGGGFSLEEPSPSAVIRPAALAKASDTLQKAQETPAASEPRFAEPAVLHKERLQKLLHSIQPQVEVASVEKVAAATPTSFVADATEIQEWDLPTIAAPEVFTQTNTIATVASMRQTRSAEGVDWLANGLPAWAQTRFDVLLVKVSGLTLGVPLISLGQIQPITNELTHIFGQADWFIGIQPTLSGKIRTVNTAKFVMPERYDENFLNTAKLLISLNGVPWGLAVDSVNQPISVEPSEIKWRADRSKRPWLAGIIKEQMCALLDIPMIGQMLMESDKNLVKNLL